MAKKLAIIASKGTLDWAYPPFILASTAAALDYEVQIFFTFYGLQLLRKDLSSVKVSPLANPAMPMPVPMPVAVQMLPGMESMATMMMKQKMKSKGVASLEDGWLETVLDRRLMRDEVIPHVPILLNTSFNEQEPIVMTPAQALDCFLRTRMDVLVLGHHVLERPASP